MTNERIEAAALALAMNDHFTPEEILIMQKNGDFDHYINDATKALKAADAVAQECPVPEGYALVPIEPTEEMISKAREGFQSHCRLFGIKADAIFPSGKFKTRLAYMAMVKAAQPPSRGEPFKPEESDRI